MILTFGKQLKKVMKERNLNQKSLAGLIGKSRGSVSQYLAETQVPTEESQEEIATLLGLSPDFFKPEDTVKRMPSSTVPQLTVAAVAKLMGRSKKSICDGLKQGVFPWGYAIKTPTGKHTYFINAKRFAAEELVAWEVVEEVAS